VLTPAVPLDPTVRSRTQKVAVWITAVTVLVGSNADDPMTLRPNVPVGSKSFVRIRWIQRVRSGILIPTDCSHKISKLVPASTAPLENGCKSFVTALVPTHLVGSNVYCDGLLDPTISCVIVGSNGDVPDYWYQRLLVPTPVCWYQRVVGSNVLLVPMAVGSNKSWIQREIFHHAYAYAFKYASLNILFAVFFLSMQEPQRGSRWSAGEVGQLRDSINRHGWDDMDQHVEAMRGLRDRDQVRSKVRRMREAEQEAAEQQRNVRPRRAAAAAQGNDEEDEVEGGGGADEDSSDEGEGQGEGGVGEEEVEASDDDEEDDDDDEAADGVPVLPPVAGILISDLSPEDSFVYHQIIDHVRGASRAVFIAIGQQLGHIPIRGQRARVPALPLPPPPPPVARAARVAAGRVANNQLHDHVIRNFPLIIPQPDNPALQDHQLNFSQYCVRFLEGIRNPDDWMPPPFPTIMGTDDEVLQFLMPIANLLLRRPPHFNDRPNSITQVHRNHVSCFMSLFLGKWANSNWNWFPTQNWCSRDAHLETQKTPQQCQVFLARLGYFPGGPAYDTDFWDKKPKRGSLEAASTIKKAMREDRRGSPPQRGFHNGVPDQKGVWTKYICLYKSFIPETTGFDGLEQRYQQNTNTYHRVFDIRRPDSPGLAAYIAAGNDDGEEEEEEEEEDDDDEGANV